MDIALHIPDDIAEDIRQANGQDIARHILVAEVARQSPATVDAKRRDLQRFLACYRDLYGHDRPDEWFGVGYQGLRDTPAVGAPGAGLDGAHHAKEACGHQSDRYIWRCVKPDRQTLAEAIDALE